MKCLVSVIITTCKGNQRLARAIRSVLRQDYSELELIVVDDNGLGTLEQRQTYEIVSHFMGSGNIQYIKHKIHHNGAVARNTGLRNSHGVFVAFLDDDDFFLPNRISCLMEMASLKKASIVYSDVIFLYKDHPLRVLSARPEGFSARDLLINQTLLGSGSNLFIKKELIENIQGFDESFIRYQDIEFLIRCLNEVPIFGVNKVLVAKDVTSSRFYPDYVSFLTAQDIFLNKFHNQIQELPPAQLVDCLYSKRVELLFSAYLYGKKASIHQARNLLVGDVPLLSVRKKLLIRLKGLILEYLPAIQISWSKYKRFLLTQRARKKINLQLLNTIASICSHDY